MTRGPDQTVTGVQIVEWITDHDDPAVFAREVANMADHSQQWARDQLSLLVDQNAIHVKIGGKEKIYWVSEELDNE